MNIKTKIASAIATGALLVSVMAPSAFAATTVTISGNGDGSTNKAVTVNKQKTKVVQSNNTAVLNLTGVFQNTGGNSANHNVGGGTVSSTSGDATSTVTNTTTTGSNTANIASCGCSQGGTVDITTNGDGSTNTAVLINKSSTKVYQSNNTLVVNGTLVVQNTGGNSANHNVGDGGVTVGSGAASSTVSNTTTTGGNSINITPTPTP